MKRLTERIKAMSRQEKLMLVLIILLLIGVLLRWENVKEKAGIWFRADELLEQRNAAFDEECE